MIPSSGAAACWCHLSLPQPGRAREGQQNCTNCKSIQWLLCVCFFAREFFTLRLVLKGRLRFSNLSTSVRRCRADVGGIILPGSRTLANPIPDFPDLLNMKTTRVKREEAFWFVDAALCGDNKITHSFTLTLLLRQTHSPSHY